MTLREWSKLTGILPTYPTTERGAVSLTIDGQHAMRVDLWLLSDYKVSSFSGPVIWLVPVRPGAERNLKTPSEMSCLYGRISYPPIT